MMREGLSDFLNVFGRCRRRRRFIGGFADSGFVAVVVYGGDQKGFGENPDIARVLKLGERMQNSVEIAAF